RRFPLSLRSEHFAFARGIVKTIGGEPPIAPGRAPDQPQPPPLAGADAAALLAGAARSASPSGATNQRKPPTSLKYVRSAWSRRKRTSCTGSAAGGSTPVRGGSFK